MSLITRCPACRTMFKVVPDQLRISDGWVRCGKCDEIFDAAANMQPLSGPPEDAVVGPLEPPPFEHAPSHASPSSAATHADAPLAADVAVLDFDLDEALGGIAPAAAEPAASEPRSSRPAPLDPVIDATAARAAEPTLADQPLIAEPEGRAAEAAPPSTPVELSFMRKAGRASAWHRPLVRALLLLMALLLLGGLVGQVALHERDRLAAMEPRIKPLLQEACGWLGCQVGPWRQIESVVIDSSTFSKIKGDVYKLSLTLKNTALVDLAMPAIELTLTDTLDQPLLRRVMQPVELGLHAPVIPAGGEVQAIVALQVRTDGTERVAGYRVLAFYP